MEEQNWREWSEEDSPPEHDRGAFLELKFEEDWCEPVSLEEALTLI